MNVRHSLFHLHTTKHFLIFSCHLNPVSIWQPSHEVWTHSKSETLLSRLYQSDSWLAHPIRFPRIFALDATTILTSALRLLTINMSAAFGLADSLFLLLLFKTAQSSVIFERVDPDVIRFGGLTTCSSLTIQTVPSALSCARACFLHSRCRTFLYDKALSQCSLLERPCNMPVADDSLRIMTRRQLETWRFESSRYFVTSTKGTFSEMQVECARHGMYMWIPNSQGEMDFITNSAKGLSTTFKYVETTKIYYDIWIGVLDKPNGNCLLLDMTTPCPIKKYAPGEPNRNNEECNQFFERVATSAFEWDDTSCSKQFYAVCEGR